MRSPPNQATEDETFTLYAYRTPGLFVEYPEPLSLRTLPSGQALREALDTLFARPEARLDSETHIFVCTHGTRDCRCGVVGTELHDALQQKVQEHVAQCKKDGSEPARRVRVLRISHVGGHKWAANALVYPHGDWYGNLRVSDAPLLLRAALAPASSRHDLQDLRERLVDAREHMNLWGPPVVYSAQITPRARGAATGAPTSSAAIPTARTNTVPSSRSQATHAPLRFHGYDGQWYDVEGIVGETLMETAKRHNLPSIEATCGGELECATCHAYLCDAQRQDPQARGDVDHVPSGADALFGPMSDEEDDMLEYAIDRRASSRLTCQIAVSHRIADWMHKGGRVELPRY
ncbi:lipoyl synthase [Malassezia brasiliensis]|uniref:Lipoyl synthase n=1 Tax=Malassezia brasiliensis TaxID=1821822 RepID=A0AAF0DR49_9BASI|nr:lipoyl synthase [Malassezia brasiliensis]